MSAGQTGDTLQVFRGSSAPLASLTLSSDGKKLYAGSWDKSIWSWNVESGALDRRFHGHADFVKALLFIQLASKRCILVSGSADASIIIWDADDGRKLHVLKGHTRGILALALDPVSITDEALIIFSASSEPRIRRWVLQSDLSTATELDAECPILQHETSVNALRFDEDADLWTASSDGTSKCLSRSVKWQADTVLRHGDYVRDVVLDDLGGFVATVGRNEDVKIWEKGSQTLWHTFSGHFEEITGAVLLQDQLLITVSIDCTVRKWSMEARSLKESREKAAKAAEIEDSADAPSASMLTEDEERELAELMADD